MPGIGNSTGGEQSSSRSCVGARRVNHLCDNSYRKLSERPSVRESSQVVIKYHSPTKVLSEWPGFVHNAAIIRRIPRSPPFNRASAFSAS
jgi:hypothetical protein